VCGSVSLQCVSLPVAYRFEAMFMYVTYIIIYMCQFGIRAYLIVISRSIPVGAHQSPLAISFHILAKTRAMGYRRFRRWCLHHGPFLGLWSTSNWELSTVLVVPAMPYVYTIPVQGSTARLPMVSAQLCCHTRGDATFRCVPHSCLSSSLTLLLGLINCINNTITGRITLVPCPTTSV
jgi:hypothetical protein